MNCSIDWPKFLARHDLLWTSKPVSWEEGAFLGNGRLGVMVYCEENREKRNLIRFVLGRTDVTAMREGGSYSPRVPIGELHLEFKGWIYQPFRMRLDLWNAELRVEIITTEGEATLTMFVHSCQPIVVAEIETSEGEKQATFHWLAHHELHPSLLHTDGYSSDHYVPKVGLIRKRLEDDLHVSVQHFHPEGSGGCVTAWKETTLQSSKNRRLILSIENGTNEKEYDKVISHVREAQEQSCKELYSSHRSWWHKYYQQSFLSIPDTRLEGFYWIQIYKLACATKSDASIIDNQGPWLTASPWPGIWFNMNVQLSYSPVYTSNRLNIGESLVKCVRSNIENLIRNVPDEYQSDSAGLGRSSSYNLVSPVQDETGNLIWVCQLLWRHYRHSMDRHLLVDLLFPLLIRAVQYHIHMLQEDEDGMFHLPPTVSPEYGSFLHLTVPDTHYDLALLIWGCRTLLHISSLPEISASINDETLEKKRKTWKKVLQKITPLPVDETGYMIGRGQTLEFGHRHFSHLMAIYPLRIIDFNREEERELALRSLRYWLHREGDLRGFTFAGAASIAATLGLGNEALQYVRSLLELITPNTMYKEAGPVIESPLAGAEAIQDMLLQSWDGIRVFPAMPDEWEDAVFYHLCAEGGFLVSAVRSGGYTSWICIRSLAGEPCRVKANFKGEIQIVRNDEIKRVSVSSSGWIELQLSAGEEVVLQEVFLEREVSSLEISPIRETPHFCNYYGGHKPWRLYGLPL